MKLHDHLFMFLVGFFGWLSFFLLGYPSNYFTEWNLSQQIVITLITFFAVVPFLGVLVLRYLGGNYFVKALWAAFYASCPLIVLDFVVVGLVQGQGLTYLTSHWYVTIAYFYVWIELPMIGLALRKLKG